MHKNSNRFCIGGFKWHQHTSQNSASNDSVLLLFPISIWNLSAVQFGFSLFFSFRKVNRINFVLILSCSVNKNSSYVRGRNGNTTTYIRCRRLYRLLCTVWIIKVILLNEESLKSKNSNDQVKTSKTQIHKKARGWKIKSEIFTSMFHCSNVLNHMYSEQKIDFACLNESEIYIYMATVGNQ